MNWKTFLGIVALICVTAIVWSIMNGRSNEKMFEALARISDNDRHVQEAHIRHQEKLLAKIPKDKQNKCPFTNCVETPEGKA